MSYSAEVYKAAHEAADTLRKALSLRASQGYALVPGVFDKEGPISDDTEEFTDILWWHNEDGDDVRPYIPLGASLTSHEKATDVLQVHVWDDDKQAMISPIPINYLPPHIIAAFVDVMLATMEEADNMDTFRHNVGEELLAIYRRIGMDPPASHSDIVEFCAKEVRETADPREWNSDDVAIAFRRWMEWAGQVVRHVDDTIIDPPAKKPAAPVGTFEVVIRSKHYKDSEITLYVNAETVEAVVAFAELVGGKIAGCVNSRGLTPEDGVNITVHALNA